MRALVIVLALASAVVTDLTPFTTRAESAPQRFRATGHIKSFGPGRAFVNIAHDDIPGFMGPMTMSFHARSAGQLGALAAGDPVRFEFEVESDGRRVLLTIEKS